MNKQELISRINKSKYLTASCWSTYQKDGDINCIWLRPKNHMGPYFNTWWADDERYDHTRTLFIKWLDSVGWWIDIEDYGTYMLIHQWNNNV